MEQIKDDKRMSLPTGFLIPCDKGHIQIEKTVGRGGNCIVYESLFYDYKSQDSEPRGEILKEFYPVLSGGYIPLRNLETNNLIIDDSHLAEYEERKNRFEEGEKSHVISEWKHNDISLPSMFAKFNKYNTVYIRQVRGEGTTLSKLDIDKMSIEKKISIIVSICKRISYFHKENQLYLDTKPDNFMYVESLNNDDLIKFVDFNTVESVAIVQKGNAKYYPSSEPWSPPEQVTRQYELIGFHSDMFSIGAVFFWLLTGNPPTAEDLYCIENEEFEWTDKCLSLKNHELSVPVISDIEKRLLQTDVYDRKQDFPSRYSCKQLIGDFNILYELIRNEDHIRDYQEILLHEVLIDFRAEYSDLKLPEGHYLGDTIFVNIPNGFGKITYADDTFYSGGWKKGKREGIGERLYPSGCLYKGHYKNNCRDGYGVLVDNKGSIIYKGEWRNDLPEGRGELKFSSGDNYIGEFRLGHPNGAGILYKTDGSKFEGIWIKCNIIDGELDTSPESFVSKDYYTEYNQLKNKELDKIMHQIDSLYYTGMGTKFEVSENDFSFVQGKWELGRLVEGTTIISFNITADGLKFFQEIKQDESHLKRRWYESKEETGFTIEYNSGSKCIIMFHDGSKYSGDIVDSECKGVFEYRDGTIFSGTFSYGSPYSGEMKLKNGCIYQGSWNKLGIPEKGGVFYDAKGNKKRKSYRYIKRKFTTSIGMDSWFSLVTDHIINF